MDETQALIRQIVTAFAAMNMPLNGFEETYCPHCKGYPDDDQHDWWHHDQDCLVLKARQLVQSFRTNTQRPVAIVRRDS